MGGQAGRQVSSAAAVIGAPRGVMAEIKFEAKKRRNGTKESGVGVVVRGA